jgi:hypothetical protein
VFVNKKRLKSEAVVVLDIPGVLAPPVRTLMI